jgi:hypothetical protein
LKGQAAGMTRNSQQVLGKEVSEEYKSRFLIYWTQKGEPHPVSHRPNSLVNIPVLNLGTPSVLENVQRYLQL